MIYDREEENQKAQTFVKELSLHMKPEEAVLVDALKENPQHASGEHYTFSCFVSDELRKKIEPITDKLHELDPSLVLNDSKLYHLTVFWCSMDKDVKWLSSIFKEELKKKPLSFDLHGLAALPFGISLKAYPTNDGFFRVRERLYEAVGQEFPLNSDGTLHERAISTWITLGRYTQAPSKQLQAFINERLDWNLGKFTPDSFGIYISNNKYLYQPQLLELVINVK
jgi:hypothetical protein